MRLYGKWRVELPGETYVWAPDDITLAEALMIEGETGTTFDEWVTGIDQRSAVPCQVLVWFLRRKDGRQEDRMTVDFPIRRLDLIRVVEDPEASAGSEPATSQPSPETSESAPGNGDA